LRLLSLRHQPAARLVLPLRHVPVLEAHAVRLQVRLRGEGPVAHVTAVGSVPGVTPGVLLQRALVVEGFLTLWTLEPLPLGVDEGVPPQVFLPPVGLTAQGAGVGFQARVDLGVGWSLLDPDPDPY